MSELGVDAIEQIDDQTPPTDFQETDYTLGLFDGDQGTLDHEQRRCLVSLIKFTHISVDSHPELWATLLAHTEEIRSRLHDLMLGLEIDRRVEVAYTYQIHDPATHRPIPQLQGTLAYTREQTLLLVHIRDLHRQALGQGQSAAFVDEADLLEFVENHRPESDANRAFNTKKAQKAIEQLKAWTFLSEVESEQRYRISNVIETVMDVRTLENLLERLETGSGQDESDDGDDDSEDEDEQ